MMLGPVVTDPDRERLQAHVRELCDEHDLEWRQDADIWRHAEGDLGQRWIRTPPLGPKEPSWRSTSQAGNLCGAATRNQ
jgi:hypothetical protein